MTMKIITHVMHLGHYSMPWIILIFWLRSPEFREGDYASGGGIIVIAIGRNCSFRFRSIHRGALALGYSSLILMCATHTRAWLCGIIDRYLLSVTKKTCITIIGTSDEHNGFNYGRKLGNINAITFVKFKRFALPLIIYILIIYWPRRSNSIMFIEDVEF